MIVYIICRYFIDIGCKCIASIGRIMFISIGGVLNSHIGRKKLRPYITVSCSLTYHDDSMDMVGHTYKLSCLYKRIMI